MKHYSTHFLTVGLGLLLPWSAAAQTVFSSAHGNYAGLDGATWNPATLADNRYSFQLQLIGFDAYATNNAYRYTGPWTPRSSGTSLDLSEQYLQLQPGDNVRLGGAGMTVRGPGVLLRLNERNTIAASTRVRMAVQVNQTSPDFIRNAVNEFQQRADVRNQTFNLNMSAMSEWNLSYGRVVFDKGHHFLKTGATVRRLSGLGAAYLQMRALDYEVVTRTAATGDSTLHIKRMEGGLGYSNLDAFEDFDPNAAAKWLKPQNAPGSGWGLDLGLVYEFRPEPDQYYYTDKKGKQKIDHSRNKYKLRLSAALTDLGSVRYRDQVVNYADINVQNLKVSEADVQGIDLDEFDTRMNRILRTVRYQRDNELTTKLPTALHLDVDYRVLSRLYVNAAINQGITGRYAVGMRTFSTATLTPRIETKWIEVAPSLALLNNYSTFSTGLSVRMGPLLIGSNDLAGLFASSSPSGVNAFAELSLLNFANKRPKTRNRKQKKLPPTTPMPAQVIPAATPAVAPAPAATPAETPAPAVAPTEAQPIQPEAKPATDAPAPAVAPETPVAEPARSEPAATPAPESSPAETTPTSPTPAPPAPAR